jgi:hypothetical protein
VTNDYREKEKEREKHSQNNSLDSDQRYMLARGTMLYIVHKQTNWKRTTNTHTHTHTHMTCLFIIICLLHFLRFVCLSLSVSVASLNVKLTGKRKFDIFVVDRSSFLKQKRACVDGRFNSGQRERERERQ